MRIIQDKYYAILRMVFILKHKLKHKFVNRSFDLKCDDGLKWLYDQGYFGEKND